MRRRMLFSTLVVAVIAVMLLGLPLGALAYQSVYSESLSQLRREADVIAAETDAQLENEGRVDTEHFAEVYPGRRIEITPPNGRTVVTGGWDYTPGDASAGTALEATATSRGNVRVDIWRDTSDVRDSIISAWVGIASLSLLAIGVAVGLAILQARRLTLPLVDLAATAERLGSGVTTPWGHRYGIPEADRVAEVLDRSAERIASLISTERHFATDASHQLRTPLTALSMRLEEIIAEADDPQVVREEGQAALAQTERLVGIVESLLGRARKSQNPEVEPVRIDDVIEQFVDEWSPMFTQAGRELRLTGTPGLTALTVPTDLTQILATLVENAFKHGAGTVTIRRVETGQSVRVEVTDEGEGIPEELAPRIFEREVSGGDGTGLGLALARHIAESEGARVELVQARPTTFAVFLPSSAGGLVRTTGPV
ncbi:sensor histidine kinase [Marinactinospora thermotolerans]|uniref:histidine kinase n=1 Tax=Marinactinospora thermotolerans DSM 45154 TaxID=1122192 RepID=A0A1T4QNV8_9ACTN|nr:HAMP domain-containing sensor histidine kinase [Marinactinospora thermotolerans]SKA05375.1 Signal transduction histidine kinase [Marinactinospora thermotolerans DSM 45154]